MTYFNDYVISLQIMYDNVLFVALSHLHEYINIISCTQCFMSAILQLYKGKMHTGSVRK